MASYAHLDREYWSTGNNERKVGQAQRYVVERMRDMIDQLEDSRTEAMQRVGYRNSDLLRQCFSIKARLPMKSAYAWAIELELGDGARHSFLMLFAIANAHGLILELMGEATWKAQVDHHADVVVKSLADQEA